jgi:hypothetical protein
MQTDPNVCVIVTGANLINVMNGKLWLSELYLRLGPNSSNSTIHVGIGGELFMTKMTIQGDGVTPRYTALSTLDRAKIFVEGVASCLCSLCT